MHGDIPAQSVQSTEGERSRRRDLNAISKKRKEGLFQGKKMGKGNRGPGKYVCCRYKEDLLCSRQESNIPKPSTIFPQVTREWRNCVSYLMSVFSRSI